ncbi:MAG: cation transporter [Alphaproteobacteria bacterium]|nr:cation transporter [Alphaproteobacteria bacterium]
MQKKSINHHHHGITPENEQKTLAVIVLSAVTMLAEIIFGVLTNSMALLADGYHMGTHVLALGLTYGAYVVMRRCKNSDRFPCGVEKIGVLSAYTSALFLGLTGIWILFEAFTRLLSPLAIHFDEAILVAVIGFIINALCIYIMEAKGKNARHSQDYNFLAAYYHILADALTSVLAIAALCIGKYTGIVRFDALIGAIGGILILKWASGLLKHTVTILLDMKTKDSENF